MGKLQQYTYADPLRDLKLAATEINDVTFSQENINRLINIGAGTYNGNIIEEQILTDGIIKIEQNNKELPSMVLLNNYLKLDTGLSIKIKIENAKFFINIIKCNNTIQYDVHTLEENKEILQHILNLINNYNINKDDISSISIKHPGKISINNYINGKHQCDYINFYDNYKTKKKRRH